VWWSATYPEASVLKSSAALCLLKNIMTAGLPWNQPSYPKIHNGMTLPGSVENQWYEEGVHTGRELEYALIISVSLYVLDY